MKKFSLFSLLSVILVGLLSTGCDDSGIYDGRVCTEIGCDDGVTIRVSEERPDSLSFTIYLNDDTEAFASTQCTDPDHLCILGVDRETPEIVRVEIGWDNGEFNNTYTPEYEGVQPNGPECPPTCTVSLIDIDLSGV